MKRIRNTGNHKNNFVNYFTVILGHFKIAGGFQVTTNWPGLATKNTTSFFAASLYCGIYLQEARG